MQKFILRLNVKVIEKKTLFCICLCGCRTLRHFSLEDQLDIQKRELVNSPHSQSSVFISFWILVCGGIDTFPLASQAANLASN